MLKTLTKGSEYQTSPVFQWSKWVLLVNGCPFPKSDIFSPGQDLPSSTITIVTTSIVFSMEKCQLETEIVQWGSENRTCRDFEWFPVFEWFGLA